LNELEIDTIYHLAANADVLPFIKLIYLKAFS